VWVVVVVGATCASCGATCAPVHVVLKLAVQGMQARPFYACKQTAAAGVPLTNHSCVCLCVCGCVCVSASDLAITAVDARRLSPQGFIESTPTCINACQSTVVLEQGGIAVTQQTKSHGSYHVGDTAVEA
jgi:hypothetical protein